MLAEETAVLKSFPPSELSRTRCSERAPCPPLAPAVGRPCGGPSFRVVMVNGGPTLQPPQRPPGWTRLTFVQQEAQSVGDAFLGRGAIRPGVGRRQPAELLRCWTARASASWQCCPEPSCDPRLGDERERVDVSIWETGNEFLICSVYNNWCLNVFNVTAAYLPLRILVGVATNDCQSGQAGD